MARRAVRLLRVTRAAANPVRGVLRIGLRAIPVALGRSGIRANKTEGDGATPRGRLRLISVFWRPDRGPRPITLLPARPIARDLVWCDDPAKANYNRLVRIPPNKSPERLWRRDGLYDLLVVLDYNFRPRRAKRGSAIFVHVARPGLAATAGCIAMPVVELRRLLARVSVKTKIDIG
jgi:L,D-peptidoglycan transpeptidase YkuD (ErfK/YbiS/YcfS/YnhG family)